ncbi:MAG: hypothetical protein ACK2UW_19040 [Anaerolineales bacterium]
MAKNSKFDGVVEAVHYNTDGMIKWVRVYERRGPTFSDLVLIPREDLIRDIKSGKVYMAGRRLELMASTFEVTSPLRVEGSNDSEVLVSGSAGTTDHDLLADVPTL